MIDKRLPNFFILGAAKAGTTSLYHHLKIQPQIFLPVVKEPHFFDDDTNYARGLDAYLRKHFKKSSVYLARGEATPAYLRKVDIVAPRMSKVYQDQQPRFIVILRDPVKRAWSHFLHGLRLSIETEDFEMALVLEQSRLASQKDDWRTYYSDGLYANQIKEWFKYFQKETFHFILLDDLKENPNETLEKACKFLKVDKPTQLDFSNIANMASRPKNDTFMRFLSQPSGLKEPLKLVFPRHLRKQIKESLISANLKPYKNIPTMKTQTEKALRCKFSSDIKQLEKILNRDLSMWLPRENPNFDSGENL